MWSTTVPSGFLTTTLVPRGTRYIILDGCTISWYIAQLGYLRILNRVMERADRNADWGTEWPRSNSSQKPKNNPKSNRRLFESISKPGPPSSKGRFRSTGKTESHN